MEYPYHYPQFHAQVIAKKTAFFQPFFPWVQPHLAQAKLIANQCAKRWRGTKPRSAVDPGPPNHHPEVSTPLEIRANRVPWCPCWFFMARVNRVTPQK